MMKKGLNIPEYKQATKKDAKNYGLLSVLVIATVVLFGGLSLQGLTGYDTFENFPVAPAVRSNYEAEPLLNRGSNPITLIKTTPENVIAGGTIYIEVDPGLKCSWQRMKIFYWGSSLDSEKKCGMGVLKEDNVRSFSSRDVDAVQRGGFEVCQTKTIPYTTSAGWNEGTYAVAVFDYNLNDWVCDPFVVYRANARSEDVLSWGGLNILNK